VKVIKNSLNIPSRWGVSRNQGAKDGRKTAEKEQSRERSWAVADAAREEKAGLETVFPLSAGDRRKKANYDRGR
jgi:hypothetical protein